MPFTLYGKSPPNLSVNFHSLVQQRGDNPLVIIPLSHLRAHYTALGAGKKSYARCKFCYHAHVRILVCWIGVTDLVAAGVRENRGIDAGVGPIGQALAQRDFDQVFLLSNFEKETNA
jgi:hypothetical protein